MLALLAQANPRLNKAPAGGGGAGPMDDLFTGVMLVVLLVLCVVGLVIGILFLMTLSKALSRCAPENRTMEPGQVWLNLIPCFNIVWQFITVNRIAESLDNEFYARGSNSRDDYGKSLGIWSCVLRLLGFIPFVGPFLSLGGLVCGIIYWVKIAGYSKQLDSRGGYDDYDDDDYDRPRKKKKKKRVVEDDYDDDDDYDDR